MHGAIQHGHAVVELRQKADCVLEGLRRVAMAMEAMGSGVDDKMKSGMTDREAFRASIHEAYDADPELRLVLQFRARKVINGPFTYRLETAGRIVGR
eukprot:Skav225088  [mRNA]  locus=scaffold1341:96574:100176:- [translate_table: standard]